MSDDKSSLILQEFSNLEDPRADDNQLYPLSEVLLVLFFGVICTSDSYRDIVDYGNLKLDYLRKYFPYKNGIVSKSQLQNIVSSINPEHFRSCFANWIQSLGAISQDVIAIDGKTLRHSFDSSNGRSPIHMVSAFASQARLVLGQIKVDDKSNEITAIPKLLNILEIKGNIVTIDAMGCQKKICNHIIEKEADYVLSLKGNQGNLHKDIKLFFEEQHSKNFADIKVDYFEKTDGEHGRIEIRKHWITDDIDWLDDAEKWRGLKAIGMIESTRIIKDRESKEVRYYIASIKPDVQLFAKAARGHWGIENSLHWVLDMTFNEDYSRVRDENAAENLAIVRHIAINAVQKSKHEFKGSSIKNIRKKAGWDNNLMDIIAQNIFL